MQASPPALSVRMSSGALAAPTFRAAARRLGRQAEVRGTAGEDGARGERQRSAGAGAPHRRDARDMRRCRAGTLPAPALSRRSFAFVCLHGFVLPAAMVEGSCAIDLRPRGTPSGIRAPRGRLDVRPRRDLRHARRRPLRGVQGRRCLTRGAENMDDLFPLYIVRCGSGDGDTEAPLPARDASVRPRDGGRELRRDPRRRRRLPAAEAEPPSDPARPLAHRRTAEA